MPDSVNHWVTPLIPVVLMLSIIIANHVVTGQRNDRKTAAEASRFSAALAAELRAMLDLYKIESRSYREKGRLPFVDALINSDLQRQSRPFNCTARKTGYCARCRRFCAERTDRIGCGSTFELKVQSDIPIFASGHQFRRMETNVCASLAKHSFRVPNS